ncbi:ProQ/FINO family protein [Acidovorax sp. NPDC077693]|uniref:ProQ/FINO family protein n=1 Tax=unclassified Acidovorax TaxID=2684926 RepID=UPI0037C6C317
MTDSVSAQKQQPNAATTAPAAAAEPVSTEAAAAAAGAASAAPAGAPASERARRSGGQRRGGGDRRGGRGGAPRQGAAPQGDAATAQGPAGDGAARTPPRTTHPLLEQLADLYPHLFGAVFRPLKRGVFQDLLAAHPEAFDRDALKVALGLHTRSTRYLQSVAAGDKRHDLAGQPVEAMAPEHVHHALLEVYRRRKNNKARATEDLLPKLRNRMMAAFEASGMSRETYTELVRGRDDAANAILEEAFAEWSARNAKDEALLRAFEASGQTLEAFADMYGMVARTVGQQLERARRLNAARAQQAADAAAAASASAAPAATAAPAASAESAAPAEHADAAAAAPAAPAQDH